MSYAVADPEQEPVFTDWDAYFLDIAGVVSTRAKCTTRQVGAVLVGGRTILSTGYNGTAAGTRNCTEGGCPRCAHPERYKHGHGYDFCLCVHAEANAIAQAAKNGVVTMNSVIYSTLRPCFGCLKLLIQAGVSTIIYDECIEEPVDLEQVYQQVLYEAGITCYGRDD